MERERSIQDAVARAGNRVLTFETDESFTQAVAAMIELSQPGVNGHVNLESVLLERGIDFELRPVR